jgi:sortase A
LRVTVVLKMSGATKWMERCLWAIGFLALAAWVGVWFNARQQQAEGNRELERRLETPRGTEASRALASSPRSPRAGLAEGALVGRIEIPRLHISTIVFEGTDDNVLSIGVGHLSHTALPGEPGNVVLAAHRDTFFRPLRGVQKYDRISVVTPSGTRRYQVDSTAIVSPNYLEVLAPTPGATLTLVTCYPFEWFGHAPKRFIVRAHEVDDPNPSRAPVSGANAQPRAEGSRSRITADRLPPVYAKHAAIRAVALSHYEPLARQLGVGPAEGEISPALRDGSVPSVAKQESIAVQETAQPTVVQETTETAASANGIGAGKNNRLMRGLKKLNPKRLVDKIAGQ